MSEYQQQRRSDQPAKSASSRAEVPAFNPDVLSIAAPFSPDHILQLQRLVGNQATQRLLKPASHIQRDSQEKTKQEKAKDVVTGFENETGDQSAFPKLSKAEIISGLRSRIDNPEQINQAGLNACGPAAVVYGFAAKDPEAYATLVIKLFKYGSAAEGTYVVKPGDDLKGKGPDNYTWKNKPSQVDWMLLSSLRDTENSVSDFEGSPDEDASAITMPGEMTKWLGKMMGYKTIDDQTNLYFTKGIDHVATVNTKRGEGNYVTLLINANMLGNTSKKQSKKGGDVLSGIPNHWVVLKSDIDASGDTVKFKIYTWGSLRDVECSKTVFGDNYYGAIFAK